MQSSVVFSIRPEQMCWYAVGKHHGPISIPEIHNFQGSPLLSSCFFCSIQSDTLLYGHGSTLSMQKWLLQSLHACVLCTIAPYSTKNCFRYCLTRLSLTSLMFRNQPRLLYYTTLYRWYNTSSHHTPSRSTERIWGKMKVLCVAEKPSIAKSITEILSGGRWDTVSLLFLLFCFHHLLSFPLPYPLLLNVS